MPCCSKELFPLSLFHSAFSLPSLPLLTSDFPKTLRGRRQAEQSQSHHLDLSKHSGEGGGGRQKRDKKGEGDKMSRGTNSLHDRVSLLDLNTLCVYK